jgi:phosphohistidine phosphatase
MDLILWRHDEARDAAEGEDDLERPLTGKGERQAQRMAQWLHRHLPDSARVLASPALRTCKTAEALGRRYKIEPALAPDRDVTDLLRCARWPHAREPVLLVGHQPTLGLAAAHLMAGISDPWTIRKGAVWWLRLRAGAVSLHAVVSPDSL